jgi:hypothetical protein
VLPDQRPLASFEANWSPFALDSFLRDPLAVRPSSRMPLVPLNHAERQHLVAALVGPIAAAEHTAAIQAFMGAAWLVAAEKLSEVAALGPPTRKGLVNGCDVVAFFGRRLVVAGKSVMDNDGVHQSVTREGAAELAAGCANCHGAVHQSGATPTFPARGLAEVPATPTGCLADAARPGMARYFLDDA